MKPSTLFLKECTQDFLHFMGAEKGLTTNSLEAYEKDLEQFESFLISEGLELKSIGYRDLRNFLSFLRKRNQSQSSLSRKVSSVRQFFKFLVRENRINEDPSELLSVIVKKKVLPEILSLDEIKRLIEAAEPSTPLGIRDRALLEFWYSTGARVTELSTLAQKNVDLKKGWVILEGKGRRQRKLPLTTMATAFGKKYSEVRHEWVRKTGSELPNFFISPLGKEISRQALWKLVKAYARKANLSKKVWPHMIRHSFATHVLTGGADLRVVQELLGHRSISTTEIYTHLKLEDLKIMQLKYHPRG